MAQRAVIASVVFAAACGVKARQVSESRAGAYEAALATGRDGFAVAWHDLRDGNAEIYLRLLDAAGHPASPERRLTDSPEASYEPSLERLGDGVVVAWYEQTNTGERTTMLGEWNRDGSRNWVHAIAPSSRNAVVRSDGREIFCAWIQMDADQSEAVWAGRWDRSGHELRPAVRLGPASATTWNLNAALDQSGGAWVVFDAADSTRANELFLARVDASGTHFLRLTSDDGAASKYPDVSIATDGRVAITWYDERDGNEEVYLLTAAASELTGDVEARARRVTTTPGQSMGAYLAWNAGRVGLAWTDTIDGQHEVYFRLFDADGAPLGDASRITQNDTWSLVPAIRAWRDGFALAWNEYRPASAEIHDGTSEVAFALVK